MRVYGNLINRVIESSKMRAPKVGDGATIIMYSDRHACTIVSVDDREYGVTVGVKRDRAIRTDSHGMSDAQSYRYEPDPAARVEVFTLRENGSYVAKGSRMRSGTILAIGHRDEYHDYSF